VDSLKLATELHVVQLENIQMTREELIAIIARSKIFQHWHWFAWHFQHSLRGAPNTLADSVIDTCLICERRIPGYAERTINLLANIGGREKHLPDWEQLLQVLAELLVVGYLAGLDWGQEVTFESEPTAQKGGKNPEALIRSGEMTLAVEVKAPALFSHQEARSSNAEQVASRFAPQEKISGLLQDPEKITYPRDNPIKDFLVSAQSKLEQFEQEPNFVGVLAIVWDDFIYEPISALLQPDSGLLTENSFYKNKDGKPITFSAVGAVLIIRQLHQFVRACRDEQLADELRHPLQYDIGGGFPPKVLVVNPFSEQLTSDLYKILQAEAPSRKLGAEYSPKELIWWF